jgi:hypothetical protein
MSSNEVVLIANRLGPDVAALPQATGKGDRVMHR